MISERILYISLVIIALPTFLSAQTDTSYSKNNLYVEFGGNGLLGSINYERIIDRTYFLKAGTTLLPDFDGDDFLELKHLLLIMNLGHLEQIGKNSFVEIGIGPTLTIPFKQQTNDEVSIKVSGVVGYRYQPKLSGFLFRVSWTPFFYNVSSLFWFGISFGYHF